VRSPLARVVEGSGETSVDELFKMALPGLSVGGPVEVLDKEEEVEELAEDALVKSLNEALVVVEETKELEVAPGVGKE